jgi:vacuole morphology and inheritance protein 14
VFVKFSDKILKMFSDKPEGNKEGESPLQQSTTRNLSDKLYEKRKMGALEVEQLVKELNVSKDHEKIKLVISHLVKNFSDSSQGNSRKGGLIALAATAIGLGSVCWIYFYC